MPTYREVIETLERFGFKAQSADPLVKSTEMALGDQVMYVHHERGALSAERKRRLETRNFRTLYFYTHPHWVGVDVLRSAGFSPGELRFGSSLKKFPKRQNQGKGPEHYGTLFSVDAADAGAHGRALIGSSP